MIRQGDPGETGLGQSAQSAEYIADMTGELAKLARRSHLELLAYLLDIANLEARNAAGGSTLPRRRTQRLARAAQG